MAVYPIKKFIYKRKTYKFKEPLKIYINDVLANDCKTLFSEFSIPSIWDGYSTKEPIKDHDKEIKTYLNNVFDEFLSKSDDELSDGDKAYKQKFMNLLDLTKSK